MNEKGRFKVHLKIMNDAIVFSFVMAIVTQTAFYHQTERSNQYMYPSQSVR